MSPGCSRLTKFLHRAAGNVHAFEPPFAKKPMERLSGDQNGRAAFSVPDNIRNDVASSVRTHRCGTDFISAMTTRVRPSGEMAMEVGSVVDGAVIPSLRSSSPAVGRHIHKAIAAAAAVSTLPTTAARACS